MSISLYIFPSGTKVRSININNNFNICINAINNIQSGLIPSIPQQITQTKYTAAYLNGNFTILANALNSLVSNIVTGLFTFIDNNYVTSNDLNDNFEIISSVINSVQTINLTINTSNVSSINSIPSGAKVLNVTTNIINKYTTLSPLIGFTGYTYDGTNWLGQYNNGNVIVSSQTHVYNGLDIMGTFTLLSPPTQPIDILNNNGFTYPADIGFNFNSPVIVNSYTIKNAISPANIATSWEFQASNDGINWTTLQNYINTNITPSAVISINITNNTQYTYYRLYNILGAGANTVFNGIQFYGNTGTNATLEVIVNGSTPLTIQSTAQNNPSIVGIYNTPQTTSISSQNSGVVEVILDNSPVSGNSTVQVQYLP